MPTTVKCYAYSMINLKYVLGEPLLMKFRVELRRFIENSRGMATAREIIASVIALVLGLYVTAYLVPDAISSILNASTTGWDAGLVALWSVIPVMAIITIVVIVLAILLDKL